MMYASCIKEIRYVFMLMLHEIKLSVDGYSIYIRFTKLGLVQTCNNIQNDF